MNQEQGFLFDDIVIWSPVGVDRYAQPVVDEPFAIKGHWSVDVTEDLGPQDSKLFDGFAVVDTDVATKSLAWKGKLTDLVGSDFPDNVFSVKKFSNVPDVKGRQSTKTMYLMRWKSGYTVG